MKRLIALVTVVGMTLFGLVQIGTPAHAVIRGKNGRILFARCLARAKCFDQSSTVPSWEIGAANADGTDEIVLAGPYPRSVWDDHFIANWAPDGKSAIFMADIGQGQAIWQVNSDGSNLHPVWSPPNDGTGIDDGPAFTPDGKTIIFTRCCPRDSGYSLWRINADGTGLVKVTTEIVPPGVDGPSDNLPQVSADGTRIAYHRNVVTCSDPSDCGNRIVTVNINGGNRVELTDPSLEGGLPNWSPDGTRIVFQAQGFGTIWAVNADGSGLTLLDTFDSAKSFSANPSYSPDGTKIIFAHGPSTGFRDLYTMNPDGSGLTQITKTADGEYFPQWAAA
jgi:Tol biopolymer transport system component